MTFVNNADTTPVSVHLPVRNGDPYFTESVESILSQTFSEFELVIVDHASTDETPKIIERFANRDERVKPLRYEGENFIDALNFGIKACSGEFIARMDADDLSDPERLEKQVEFLRQNRKVGFVGSAVTIFGPDGVQGGYARYEEWINTLITPEEIRREMFVESPIPNPTVMMRRTVLENLGGYLDFGWPEDYDLYLRSLLAGVVVAKLPDRLLKWRDHSGRTTRTSGRYSRKNFLKVRAHYLSKFLEGREIVIQGAGPTGRILGKFLIEFGANLKAYLDINPNREGGTKLGLPVYPASRMSEFRGCILLSAVSSWGAREIIREEAKNRGFTEGVDFFCCS